MLKTIFDSEFSFSRSLSSGWRNNLRMHFIRMFSSLITMKKTTDLFVLHPERENIVRTKYFWLILSSFFLFPAISKRNLLGRLNIYTFTFSLSLSRFSRLFLVRNCSTIKFQTFVTMISKPFINEQHFFVLLLRWILPLIYSFRSFLMGNARINHASFMPFSLYHHSFDSLLVICHCHDQINSHFLLWFATIFRR